MLNSEFSFHESTVEEIYSGDTGFFLRLSEVEDHRGQRVSLSISVDEVSEITIDDELVRHISGGPGDGEVLDLELLEDGINLIVEWEDYLPRRAVTHSYRIRGAAAEIRMI